MPQFSIHTPKSQGDMAAIRKFAQLSKRSLPIGVIGENNNFSWGFNGKYYYVTQGVLSHLLTQAHLSLAEAEKIFEALTFGNVEDVCSKALYITINQARKTGLSGDDLMWFYFDALTNK
jgi:hypothetical protein